MRVLDQKDVEKKLVEYFAGSLKEIPDDIRREIKETFDTFDMANVLLIRPPYPREFLEFFQAMSKEMLRHEEEKADSWKDDEYVRDLYYRYSSMPPAKIMGNTDEYLRNLLKKAVDEYFETGEEDRLVDVANVCAMIWCRDTILHPTRVLSDLEAKE